MIDPPLSKETLEELIQLTGDRMADPEATPEEAQAAYDDHVRYIRMLEELAIDPPFDDQEANERWLRETMDKTIFDMLCDSKRPTKPIDPNAPLPYWAKRTIQKAWIKAERERQRGMVTFTGEDLDRLSDELAAPGRIGAETDADFRTRLITFFSKLQTDGKDSK